MATSGTITKAFTDYNTLQLYWEIKEQDAANNVSYVDWELRLVSGAYGAITSTVNKKGNVTFRQGTLINYESGFGTLNVSISNNSTKVLCSDEVVVFHGSNGETNVDVRFSVVFNIDFGDQFIGQVNGIGIISVDAPKRKATITKAPNFTDEESPTIKYSNPMGNGAYKVQVGISLNNGANMQIAYRDVSKTGNSYTFNFTDDERAYLRSYNKNSLTLPLKYYIRTYYTSTEYEVSGISATMTIINAEPTLNPTITDTNSNTVAVTGNNQVIVKGMSTVQYVMGVAANKGATIATIVATNGNQKKTGYGQGTFTEPTSGDFTFSVVDSRGLSASQTVNKTLINYFKPTLTLSVTQPETEGNTATFDVSGTCFYGSFGAVSNTRTVQYRYKEDGGSYGDWTTLSVTVNGINFSGSGSVSNLDYQKSYTLQVRIMDKLNSITREAQILVKPIFSWDKDDFEFGVPVSAPSVAATDVSATNVTTENLTIDGRGFGDQVILWQGVNHLGVNDAVVLNDSISNQPNGIILIFSLYRPDADGPDGPEVAYADDVSLHSFFISKKEVELFPGKPHTFILGINAGLSMVGAKYVYINDSRFSGHLNNMASGYSTDSGLIIHNERFVLRYVLGV